MPSTPSNSSSFSYNVTDTDTAVAEAAPTVHALLTREAADVAALRRRVQTLRDAVQQLEQHVHSVHTQRCASPMSMSVITASDLLTWAASLDTDKAESGIREGGNMKKNNKARVLGLVKRIVDTAARAAVIDADVDDEENKNATSNSVIAMQ